MARNWTLRPSPLHEKMNYNRIFIIFFLYFFIIFIIITIIQSLNNHVFVIVGPHTVTVVCNGKPMNGSPFVAKAFNTSAIQLSGMPSVGVVFCPVEFTGKQSA